MHLHGWLILAACTFGALGLALLCFIAWHSHLARKALHQLDLTSDKSAYLEAQAAHTRLDRIDLEAKQDRIEASIFSTTLQALKGRIAFLMHKDISAELARQAEWEKRNKGPE
jgi:hypothetical protein